jgi:hypothetical protein
VFQSIVGSVSAVLWVYFSSPVSLLGSAGLRIALTLTLNYFVSYGLPTADRLRCVTLPETIDLFDLHMPYSKVSQKPVVS